MEHPDDGVGDREQRPLRPERLRERQAGDEDEHRREQQADAEAQLGARLRVGRPHERRPRPPDEREDEHRASEPAPGEVVGEQRGHLRDREHEHEVPQQLERARAPLVEARRRGGSARSRAGPDVSSAQRRSVVRQAQWCAARARRRLPRAVRAPARSHRAGARRASTPSRHARAARGCGPDRRGAGRYGRVADAAKRAQGCARGLQLRARAPAAARAPGCGAAACSAARRSISARCSAIAAPRSDAGPSSSSRLASRCVRRMSSSRSVARRARLLALLREREPVPRLGERDEVGPAAGAMGGEHRADPAVARVGADDDLVGADALEHRDPGAPRQALHRCAQLVDRRATPFSHRVHRLPGRRGHCIGARRPPQAISCSRKEPCR